jgi:hypothetical protein
LKPELRRFSMCDFFCEAISSHAYTKENHVHTLNIYGEKLFANKDSAEAFKGTLYSFVRNQNSSEDRIYDTDETALY